MARPITKGKKNWKVPYAVALTPEVIKWLKGKRRKSGESASEYVNKLLETQMITEIEGEF